MGYSSNMGRERKTEDTLQKIQAALDRGDTMTASAELIQAIHQKGRNVRRTPVRHSVGSMNETLQKVEAALKEGDSTRAIIEIIKAVHEKGENARSTAAKTARA